MKRLCSIAELLLTAGLIYFGDRVGTGNMWFCIAAMMTAQLIFEFLYKARRFSERNKRRNKKSTTSINDKDNSENVIPIEQIVEENAQIKTRDFYDCVRKNTI